MVAKRWLQLFGAPLADGEYIERIRRNMALWCRWRWWLAGLSGTAPGIVVVVSTIMVPKLLLDLGQWGNPKGGAMFGFEIGLPVGALIGLMAVTSAHGLMTALLPWRTEQMLLRYHDTIVNLQVNRLHGQKDKT
jgi:hypothetical protein